MQPNLTNKTHKELLDLAQYTEALRYKYKYEFLNFVMPETGLYNRHKYKKALEFFKAGNSHRFRMFGGPNGCGKSFNLALELTYHITGEYPEWWEGKRQPEPKQWWIVAESGATFRDSLQILLLGNSLNDDELGTGLIPKSKIRNVSHWPSIGGAVQVIQVEHKLGHTCTISVKTSDQKRENLQASNLDGVLFDEEPPLDIYTECLYRLRGSPTKPSGMSLMGFTPLKGLTDVVLQYLENGAYPINGQHSKDPDKYIVAIQDLDEVPHLSDEDKRAYRNNCPPHEKEARLYGRPGLGAGRIYPYSESQVFCKPRPIPEYWPRCFTLDFGHHVTCALWGAKDPHTNTLYIYAEYYSETHQTAQIHALNIKAKGAWIHGICDPSGGGRQNDGRLLQELFESEGLNLTPGENSFLAGVTRNCNMFENGTFKIFDNLEYTKNEFRVYRFDTKNPNNPARNQKDHAMDNLRYITSMFDDVATSELDEKRQYNEYDSKPRAGYDKLAGY